MKNSNQYSLTSKIEKKTAELEAITANSMAKIQHSALEALIFLGQAQEQVIDYNAYALMSTNSDWGQMKNVEYMLRHVERYLQSILKISQ